MPAVLLFLVISFELARYLSASGSERSAIVDLLRDQARGDAPAMVTRLKGCAPDPRCVSQAAANAGRLRTANARVKILLLESDSAYKLKSSTGVSRVAWTDLRSKSPTVVQCITVRKSWSLIHGARVELRRIGPRIGNEASC